VKDGVTLIVYLKKDDSFVQGIVVGTKCDLSTDTLQWMANVEALYRVLNVFFGWRVTGLISSYIPLNENSGCVITKYHCGVCPTPEVLTRVFVIRIKVFFIIAKKIGRWQA
jgi:hypothetical protein